VAGLLRPSRGEVRLFGRTAFEDREARRRLGYCPEHEGVYDELSALEFVTAMARLSGLEAATARRRSRDTLVELGLEAALDRRLFGFSKGMRQRTKLAAALVHEPTVILLDEPLTGCDPVARARIIGAVKKLGTAGKTVLVSSHVLYEIEALTQEIIVIFRGQVLAEGNARAIRDLIDQHPHRVHLECERPRELAARLALLPHVSRLDLADDGLEVETTAPESLYSSLPALLLELGIALRRLESPDDSMQAVFEVLTQGAPSKRGHRRAVAP
jgi:ABC-2 type transport system ATP-binding protein